MRVLLGLLVALASLGACDAGDPGRARQTQTIRIGMLRLPSSAPVFIAVERGYFRDEGLIPELKWFDAASAVPVAVVSGDLDVGVAGLTAAAFNLAARGGLRFVASQMREEQGFRMSAFVATRRGYEGGYTSLRELAGRRIGITTFGSTQHYNFALIARKYGLPLSRITFVPLQTLQNLRAALVGGQIDGALFPAAQSRQLEASGAVRILAWSDEVPWQLGAVFAHPETIRAQRPMLERFVRAYRKGTRAYNAAFNTRDAAGHVAPGTDYDELLAIVARHTNQSPAQLHGAMPFIDADGRIDVGSFYDQVRFWQQSHVVVRSAEPGPMFDLSFIHDHFNVPRPEAAR